MLRHRSESTRRRVIDSTQGHSICWARYGCKWLKRARESKRSRNAGLPVAIGGLYTSGAARRCMTIAQTGLGNSDLWRDTVPKRKRGNSEGSIYKMTDGRWRAAVSVGKGKRKTFTAATRHEVADQMTKALRDQQRGINIDPEKQTVGHFLSRWIDTVKRDVAPATYVSYEATVRLHLTPALGKIPLAKLGAHHVQRMKQEKLEAVREGGPGIRKAIEGQPAPEPQHLSSATVKYCLVVLRMAQIGRAS